MSYTYYVFGNLVLPSSVKGKVDKYLEKAMIDGAFEISNGQTSTTIHVCQVESATVDEVDDFYAEAASWIKGTDLDGQVLEFNYDGQSHGSKLLAGGEATDFDVGNLLVVDDAAVHSTKATGVKDLVLVEARIVKLHSGQNAVIELQHYIPRGQMERLSCTKRPKHAQ
jgi:hypothetical protein